MSHPTATSVPPHASPRRTRTTQRDMRSDAGLSLVEMVVAIGIVVIVLTSALSVFVIAKKAQQTAEGTDQATQLANEQIERIRQLDWTDIGFRYSVYAATTQGATARAATSTTADDYAGLEPGGGATIASGEETVLFIIPAPVVGSADIKPYQTIKSSNGNVFRVYTSITYGPNPASSPAPNAWTATGIGPYTFKRVTVTVHWKANGNGTPYRLYAESWFAPEAEDAVPPGVPCLDEETKQPCA